MQLTIDQALQKAVEAHKAGQIQEADRVYTAILKAQPKHPDANHNLGVLAVGVGKVNEALPFLKTALEANPSIAQFWLSYIDALIKLDRLKDAMDVLDQAKIKGAWGDGFEKRETRLREASGGQLSDVTLNEPSNADKNSTFDIALLLRDRGELDKAINLLVGEINSSSKDIEMLALLSHCHLLANQMEEAKIYLKKATEIDAENASVGWNTARLMLKEQKPLEALNLARDISKRFPDDIEGMGVLGTCLRANGEIIQSLEVLNRALELNPDYAEALINRGLIRLSQENKPGAIDDLEVAHRLKPHIKQIWDLLVGLKLEAQEYSDAIRLLINMIEIDPKDATRLATLALCYQQVKDFDASEECYKKALAIKPDYIEAYNNMGASLKEQGKLEAAIEAYKKALAIKPDYAEAYNNMGIALQEQTKMEAAIEAYKKALAIKPDNAEAYNNMGIVLQEQAKLEEAIEAYKKALAIKPDYAEAYNNMGIILKEKGKLEEAIEAYNKALAIKPDYSEAYNNIGTSLQEQGKLEEAIEAYKQALAIKPNNADAHRHLSHVTKYKPDNAQIKAVQVLLHQNDLSDPDRCSLLYTYAKMSEDLGELRSAFDSYVAGGDLRQRLLGYDYKQDEHLFVKIKQTAPKFKDIVLKSAEEPIRHIPIFILGMPRSGTTLVEQIISSHSKITGAGELPYVSQFGAQLATGITSPTLEAVSAFRAQYLAELVKKADGQAFISDKMPQNFRYIALICKTFPEAKIIHVTRNPEAICWSNFKQYFAAKGLGYSYNLIHTVKYYGLYKDLMQVWYQSYGDRIYNVDYDRLTENQVPETRSLIEHIGLNWEDACLAPQENKRSLRTASNQQVRQKVYTGSSQAWRKYEGFIGGAFDGLR
jgi:tetratricopeptide (TPR) repeat protein